MEVNNVAVLWGRLLALVAIIAGVTAFFVSGGIDKMHTETQKKNRLADQSSPYLLQHADNPVDWYPWGEEAFVKALQEDRPVFLSIGYSTCHWCHVMEHESFEDPEVAELMNEAFVCIKVDREERPDVDDVYMQVCQMMTGSGGWPLTIIMTPEKKPFFAGTYIPKNNRQDRLGMIELTGMVKEMWANDREKILNTSQTITDALDNLAAGTSGQVLSIIDLKKTCHLLRQQFDTHYGGFGMAPKFPMPHYLTFLLRYWHHSNEPEVLEIVEKTLQAMRQGGIYDHVGFGFHRYATDHKWLLPHFEKMLYDQALISNAYIETFQATGKREYAETAREIFTYIMRDMSDPQGGFYTAEDADSEGEEGKFYVWSYQELKALLTPADLRTVQIVYNVKENGNFVDEATGRGTGLNILHLTRTLSEFAEELEMPKEQLLEKLEVIRKTLFDVREKRVHPLKDTKILTDWNGLMIASLAKGGRVLGEEEYTRAAEEAANYLLSTMKNADGLLLHVKRGELDPVPGYLDDYAFFIHGLLELYESTFNVKYFAEAIALTETVIANFSGDTPPCGFYSTSKDSEQILIRRKESYDGAVPAGNSLMMLNLLRLSRLTGRVEWEDKAMAIALDFSDLVKKHPAGFAQLQNAVFFVEGPSYEIVIVGDPETEATDDIIHSLYRKYLPNKVVMLKTTRPQKDGRLEMYVPYIKDYDAVNGKATVYVCRDFACQQPVNNAYAMWEMINKIK